MIEINYGYDFPGRCAPIIICLGTAPLSAELIILQQQVFKFWYALRVWHCTIKFPHKYVQ
eukprot:scaffold2450_cov311-Chaetoceros_neogracile.AAC.7